MKRTINISKISDITTSLIDEFEIIKEAEKKLEKDIKEIGECYKGKDSQIVINKYLLIFVNIKQFNKTMNNYINYFKWLSGNYEENILKTEQQMDLIIEDKDLDDITIINQIGL